MSVIRAVSLAVLMHVLLCLSGSVAVAFCKECGDAPICGVQSLGVVCARLGIKTDDADLAALAKYDVRRGTSLSDLERAAKAKGLSCLIAKTDVDGSIRTGCLTIAQLWGKHFAVVEPAGQGFIRVTVPPADSQEVPKTDFADTYSGLALLVAPSASKLPEIPNDGPDMRFAEYSWDFGAVYQGEVLTHDFMVANVGKASLGILSVGSSCACLIPVSWPSAIEPGADGPVSVTINTSDDLGQFSRQLFVRSTDPLSRAVRIDVTGYIRSARLPVAPASIDFGVCRRSASAARAVFIPTSTSDPVAVKSVCCDSPFLSALAECHSERGQSGTLVTVTLRAGAPVGALVGKLVVESTHSREPKAEVPVTAVVTGDIAMDRDSLLLGLVKQGKESTANVIVSTVSKDPLKIGKIDNPLDCVTVDVKPKTEGKEYILTATLKPDAPLGKIKDDITVHTNDPDQPEIRIPVYAYVEKA